MPTRFAPLAAVCVALGLAGCGAQGNPRADAEARLVLDAPPSAVHAGIYLAEARGFTDAEGLDLLIEAPDQPGDSVEQLRSTRATFAVLDLHQLALAREDGEDLVAVLALLQRPQAAVFTDASVRSPRALAGARVGVTGRPADDAVLRAMVAGAGGKPSRIRRRTVGFGAVAALRRGRVEAMAAVGTSPGAALTAADPSIRRFGIEEFGAPRYPELVLVTRRATIQDTPEVVQAAVTALRRGYREVVLGPEEAVGVLVDRAEGLERRAVQAELDDVLPSLDAGGRGFGTLDLPTLERWASWEQRFGITRRRPDVARMFAPRYAQQGVISG